MIQTWFSLLHLHPEGIEFQIFLYSNFKIKNITESKSLSHMDNLERENCYNLKIRFFPPKINETTFLADM